MADGVSYPRRSAQTQRFTLGEPRSFAIAEGGSRVLFIRTRAGDDPVGCLWALDLPGGEERVLVDPRDLGADDSTLPPEERARRERAREGAGGVVAYATSRSGDVVVFALGGEAYVLDVPGGQVTRLDVAGPVVDPRPDPTGRRVAFVRAGALHVVELGGGPERAVAAGDEPDVTWGLAEFVAAEEMDRLRGYWWAPDGQRLAVARVDTTPVRRWHIADPSNPDREPVAVRYPAAGTANAAVSLHVVDLAGGRVDVAWDAAAHEYLADVVWSADTPLTVVVQSRDQRSVRVLTVDPVTGATIAAADLGDERWVDLVDGVPRWAGGRLVTVLHDGATDTNRIAVDGDPVTPPGLQVRRVVGVDETTVTFTASEDDATEIRVWQVAPDGSSLQRLSPAHAVSDAVARGGVVVMVTRSLHHPGATTVVRHPGGEAPVRSVAERPDLRLNLVLRSGADGGPATALLLPEGREAGDGGPALPVLMDPYGGPHAQRVLRSHNAFLTPQWFADQGFAVIVADGRGTPGRGPAWERTLWRDLATAPLEDQVAALHACAAEHPGLLDLARVAIRGWSFGGYLAALGVLRRPDVFAAAIAGAPVTDLALYDTHYTERYLGTPRDDAEAYRTSSILADAPRLDRPLLIIHGLADDNVVVAHSLRLSAALLEAGRPHTFLPLSGVTHMTPQEVVAENLMLVQLAFLRDALGVPADASSQDC